MRLCPFLVLHLGMAHGLTKPPAEVDCAIHQMAFDFAAVLLGLARKITISVVFAPCARTTRIGISRFRPSTAHGRQQAKNNGE